MFVSLKSLFIFPRHPSFTNILKLSGLSELFTSLRLWFSLALKYCRCLLKRDEITPLVWMLRFFLEYDNLSMHPCLHLSTQISVQMSIYLSISPSMYMLRKSSIYHSRRTWNRALLPLGTIWSSCLVGRYRCCMQGTFPGMSFCHRLTMPGMAM